MNPEIKAQWVAALRSGEFEQGTGTLAYLDNQNETTKFCCLGVLCELASRVDVSSKAKVRPREDDDREIFTYSGQEGFLPIDVTTWAGLEDTNPRVLPLVEDDVSRLTYLNDSVKKSFAEIADLIEASDI